MPRRYGRAPTLPGSTRRASSARASRTSPRAPRRPTGRGSCPPRAALPAPGLPRSRRRAAPRPAGCPPRAGRPREARRPRCRGRVSRRVRRSCTASTHAARPRPPCGCQVDWWTPTRRYCSSVTTGHRRNRAEPSLLLISNDGSAWRSDEGEPLLAAWEVLIAAAYGVRELLAREGPLGGVECFGERYAAGGEVADAFGDDADLVALG